MSQPDTYPSYLLIAPPGSGKTRFCLERIRQSIAQAPLAPVWMIVRDRLQAATYRNLLRQAGLSLGVEVATFGDLYQEILARSGGGMPVAEGPALRALLRAVVDEVYAGGRLRHFARIRELPGFTTALGERFAELKRSLVTPERLAELAHEREAVGGTDAPALLEIAELYAAYQHRLQELSWADQEGISWLGLEVLHADPGMLGDLRLVLVDGFDSFNPAQRQTLHALAGRVQSLWVTLPGDAAMYQPETKNRPAHRRFLRAFRNLVDHIPLQVISLGSDQRSDTPPEFVALEARLFEPPGPPLHASNRISLLEAQSPDEEAREALRWIKARIVRDGLSPSDCALIVPEFSAYRAAILAAAAEFGLPVRLTRAGRLVDTPPVAALLDLLYLPARNWPTRLLLDTVRAPFFDLAQCGLARADASILERVSRIGQIVEGLQQWHEALGALAAQSPARDDGEMAIGAPGASQEPEESEEGITVPVLPEGALAERLNSGLQSLASLISPPGGEQPVGEWVRWLAALAPAVGFDRCCAPGVEQQWLETLRRLLGDLEHSDRLAGSRLMPYNAFLSALQSLLAEAPAAEDLPAADHLPAMDDLPADGKSEAGYPLGGGHILVLHTFEARGLRFKAVALVGLAEGVFPAVERADPILSEPVRAALDMEQRLGQDQAGIFYQMATRADEQLLLTRPYLARDGESWEPSPFWSAVEEVLGKHAVRVRPEDNRPLCDAASAEELVFWAARRAALGGGPLVEPFAADLQYRFQALRHAHQVLVDRIDNAEDAAWHGSLSELAETLQARYGADAVWSVSSLEQYATCPFSFFAGPAIGLRVVEPPKVGIEPFQLGLLLHEALEQVYSRCPEPDNVDALLVCLPQVAERVFEAAPRRYAFRPTLLWEVQKAELLEILEAAITGLAEIDAAAGWKPVAFERRFGIEGAPSLEIQMDGLPVRLRGVIDRIDRDPSGRLRVIDYKSGSAHLAAPDLEKGRRLQLPIYALAVEDALGMGSVAEGFYWKLFSRERGSLLLSNFTSALGDGPKAACRTAVRHVERLVSGIRAGRFVPQPPEGGCPSYCPAASWCWSYREKAGF